LSDSTRASKRPGATGKSYAAGGGGGAQLSAAAFATEETPSAATRGVARKSRLVKPVIPFSQLWRSGSGQDYLPAAVAAYCRPVWARFGKELFV
jgi:hypothetical protein